MEKPIQRKQKVGIVLSLNDMTLTKVTYGKYATQDPDEVMYGIYEWFSSQQNTLLHIIIVIIVSNIMIMRLRKILHCN